MAIETWPALAAASILPPPIPKPTARQAGRRSDDVRRLLHRGGGIATPAMCRG
jgi:hypothetical protein